MNDSDRLKTIHSIALEAKPHRGCACRLCRIRHVCEGNIITPDPALLLDERLVLKNNS